MTYGEFIHGMTQAGITLDRKVLADIATRDPSTFKTLVDTARSALAKG